MSLFQCDRCGCLENTSLTNAYRLRWNDRLDEEYPAVAYSYRQVLGLAADEPFGSYCSACSPIWYDDGNYGLGPRPEGHVDRLDDTCGIWHNKFDRLFLPKALFHTNDDGNLAHVITLDTDVDKYALEAEDPGPPRYKRLKGRLPRRGSPEYDKWRVVAQVLVEACEENPEAAKEVEELGGIPYIVAHALNKPRAKSKGMAGEEIIGHYISAARKTLQEEKRREETERRQHQARMIALASASGFYADNRGNFEVISDVVKPKEPTEHDKARMAKAEKKRRRRAEKRRACEGASDRNAKN